MTLSDRHSAVPSETVGAPTAALWRWILIPVIAASGFAGLGYEVVWTRQLALILGTEIMAVSGAVAGFFGGLTLGAFLLDRLIRRAKSPARAYAILEAIIGGWGLLCIWLLPAAGRMIIPHFGTNPPQIILWAVSFALPMLLLLPATVAMGGTLTALERLVGAAWRDARVVAGVYGANTSGAVAGALVSAFLVLPALGLSGTLAVLALVNLACAGVVSLFAPRAVSAEVRQAEPIRSAAISTRRSDLALFATGFLGIAFEMLVVRIAAQVMQDTIYTFASLLAAYLLGTAIGGLVWQRAGRGTGDTSLAWLLAGTALACLGTAALAPRSQPSPPLLQIAASPVNARLRSLSFSSLRR